MIISPCTTKVNWTQASDFNTYTPIIDTKQKLQQDLGCDPGQTRLSGPRLYLVVESLDNAEGGRCVLNAGL